MRFCKCWLPAAMLLASVGSGAMGAVQYLVTIPEVPTAGTDYYWSAPYGISAGSSARYQEVFPASAFASFGGQPQTIYALQYRREDTSGPFLSTVFNIEISLSTTSQNGSNLSPTFASNVGADNQEVYSGSLTLSSTAPDLPQGVRPYDITIVLQHPFTYDPTQGNLLIDISNFSGGGPSLLAGGMDGLGTVGSANVLATTGSVYSGGLATRFVAGVLPEPSGLLLLGSMSGQLFLWRRRKR